MQQKDLGTSVFGTDFEIKNAAKAPDMSGDHTIILSYLKEQDNGNLWFAQVAEKPLDLSFTAVSDIPESILPKVKHFSAVVLSNTKITRFPKTLLDFTQIQTLDMSRCCMKELAPAIGNLTDLRYLILDHNELSFLPETIGKLTKLLELNVAYNNLRELPGTYGFLSSLKYLNLSHNELTALPTEIGKLQNLESIIASHNQISVVNPSLGNMGKLWSINLSHNPIERVPSTLVKIIPRLSLLNLEFTTLYEQVFQTSSNKHKFHSITEYLFSLPADIIVSISTFTRDMRNILNSPTFSDLKFKHGEQIYNGHRCIVSARLHRVKSDLLCMESDIMDTMKTKDSIINIKDSVPASVFEAILAYLYVADVTNLETLKDYIAEIPNDSTAEQLLAADLNALRNSGDFSDISFTVDGQEIKGHKCILAATCKTLSTFFTGEWKEARENTANLGGFSSEAVGSFFEYLYTGDTEINGENVMELLAIADVFQVDRLKEQCEHLLVEGLDEDNLLLIYETAERHSALQVIENCAYFASKNSSRKVFHQLPQRLRDVANDLVTRTKELSEAMKSRCHVNSIVHKAEEEWHLKQVYETEQAVAAASGDWGKLKGYNIRDPSEVLPSGPENTEKFLKKVLRDLNATPVSQKKRKAAPRGAKRIRDLVDDTPAMAGGMGMMNMTELGMNEGMGARIMNIMMGTMDMNANTVGTADKIGPVPEEVQAIPATEAPSNQVAPMPPMFALNDSPLKPPFAFGQDHTSNDNTPLSTSPATAPNMFAFSFSASPSKSDSNTSDSSALSTSPSRSWLPNKRGRKSPGRAMREGIFGESEEKEKSMEELLSRLNLNE